MFFLNIDTCFGARRMITLSQSLKKHTLNNCGHIVMTTPLCYS